MKIDTYLLQLQYIAQKYVEHEAMIPKWSANWANLDSGKDILYIYFSKYFSIGE